MDKELDRGAYYYEGAEVDYMEEKNNRMNKLIELLNEYIEKNINTPNRCIGYSCSYFGFDGGTDVIEDTIISKRYGFIKWLVDNDKIDYKELPYLGEYGMGVDIPTDGIIMLLSISDTPIDDLISYLK